MRKAENEKVFGHDMLTLRLHGTPLFVPWLKLPYRFIFSFSQHAINVFDTAAE